MVGSQGFTGSLPSAPLTSGTANWDWNLGFHCFLGKNLTQTEKVGSDYPDQELQGKLNIFQWETVRFSEIKISHFNLRVATVGPES